MQRLLPFGHLALEQAYTVINDYQTNGQLVHTFNKETYITKQGKKSLPMATHFRVHIFDQP